MTNTTQRALIAYENRVNPNMVTYFEQSAVASRTISTHTIPVEGLKTLHEHSVVHYDTGARNARVEMRDGKIPRVWWVDFGDACEIDEEAKIVWDVEGYRGNYPKGVAIDLDIGVFRGSIRRALKTLES